ncbi:MAG: hypothetical protein NTV06_01890 [candidate division Zixibacteria bacterium]|nr:hypothetical protein [candidate division Zixibacteria bacterium]
MRRCKNFVIPLVIIVALAAGCIKKVDHPSRTDYPRYFPLAEGDQLYYSGPMGKSVVTGNINDIFTVTFYDSAGNVTRWEDFVKTDRGSALKNRIYKFPHIPSAHYEPYLPFTPWSHIMGDTLLFSAMEIRGDTANTHLRLQAEYEIMAVEPVSTPAGNFDGCIKMRMSFKSLYDSKTVIPDGNSYWWFAKDIGIVKYHTPAGSGELLKAKIDGRVLP